MKRSLLFTLLLATFQLLNAQIQFSPQLSEQSSDPFNVNAWQSYSRLVTERSDFPALLMDTMYCESYWNDPPYDIYTLTAQAFTYNPQEQLIEVRRQEQFEGGGSNTIALFTPTTQRDEKYLLWYCTRLVHLIFKIETKLKPPMGRMA